MSRSENWKLLSTDADLALMSQVLGIKEATAQVMANRGIRSKKTAIAYLKAELKPCEDFLDADKGMKDAKKAFERIILAIQQKERLMIYGDYDADGVISTVILFKALLACGADIHYYIPNREEEGYGLNLDAVRTIKEMECDLIICCDNGISALAEIAEAQALGMDVIVIDHHEPGFVEEESLRQDVIPKALAVIDPKQSACPYPFKELCAAGLAFKLMEAFFLYAARDFSPLYDELLALATIATICDIVDLNGENRCLVKQGLAVLNAKRQLNGGLAQLISLRGYAEKPIDTFTIGFVIGPCINATGRLESAEISVRLLLSNRPEEQQSLARTLVDLNEERKEITRKSAERAFKSLEFVTDNVLVLVDEECHESIAGIVAGRIKDRTNQPTIVLTRSAEAPGILKGSGRSIDTYNLFEALYDNRDLFLRFGGHAMAAGLTLHEDNVEELRKRLNESCNLSKSDFKRLVYIDRELMVDEIDLALAKELDFLAPFGKANREPLFVTKDLNVKFLRIIDEKNTLIFTFDTPIGKLKGIAFGLNDILLEELQANFSEQEYRRIVSGQLAGIGLVMDVVHAVESNTYNGRTSVQMHIKDFEIRKEK